MIFSLITNPRTIQCKALNRTGEAGLVKLAIPIIPMLTDYCLSDPASMTKHAAEGTAIQAAIWRLIAGDLETRRGDPMVFPGKAAFRDIVTTDLTVIFCKSQICLMTLLTGDGQADRETLSQLPPMILWSSEFDIYYTETVRFAARVREVGRLLE